MSNDTPIKVKVLNKVIVPDVLHDRYASFKFIQGWDVARVRAATVLVVGAGALGNEVIKNLALSGVGKMIIVDMDNIEIGNLSRSILFRKDDMGKPKATIAAKAAQEINPDVQTRGIVGRLEREIGLGVIRRVSAVVGCLDNREARFLLNRACWKVQKPWVDGALGDSSGEARLFWPGKGACYECTLTKQDYEMLAMRYSCGALFQDLIPKGIIPTTPTIASVVAGVQSQEALKLIHEMDCKPGSGLVFNGAGFDAYHINYSIRDGCLGHEVFEPIYEFPELSSITTLGKMLIVVQERLGSSAYFDIGFEIITDLECSHCNTSVFVLKPASEISDSLLICPVCGNQRIANFTHKIAGNEPFLDKTLCEIGIPPLDILMGQNDERIGYFELTGDYGSLFSFA